MILTVNRIKLKIKKKYIILKSTILGQIITYLIYTWFITAIL
jgi:hypothetical protein